MNRPPVVGLCDSIRSVRDVCICFASSLEAARLFQAPAGVFEAIIVILELSRRDAAIR